MGAHASRPSALITQHFPSLLMATEQFFIDACHIATYMFLVLNAAIPPGVRLGKRAEGWLG